MSGSWDEVQADARRSTNYAVLFYFSLGGAVKRPGRAVQT